MEDLHAGTPPSDYECWETKIIHFHNFLDLPDTKGNDNVVESPKFKCFGHTWRLKIYPGGDIIADHGYISAYINNLSDEKITVDFEIIIMKADGNESKKLIPGKEVTIERIEGIGTSIVSRATLIESPSEYLDKGALKIKVKLRLSKKCYNNTIRQQLPENNYMDISGDEETADVAFDLQGEILVAHKCIIKSRAKNFYVMCEGYNKESPMPITDVDKEIFDMMLASLYGGEVFPEEWKKHSGAILKAASKYGFDRLKSEAEVWCAKSVEYTVDNVIGKFMEADGNGYALLKAAAKKFIIEHGEKVVASESLELLRESLPLMREVMAAAFQNSKKRKREDEEEA
eukprot:scaffold27065_cov30-Cyclotella_meneghiniana.AAC.1